MKHICGFEGCGELLSEIEDEEKANLDRDWKKKAFAHYKAEHPNAPVIVSHVPE